MDTDVAGEAEAEAVEERAGAVLRGRLSACLWDWRWGLTSA